MLTETNENIEHKKRDMQVKASPLEVEAKWRLQNIDEQKRIRKLLRQLGGRFIEKHEELNQIFDNAAAEYERSEKVIRLRFMNRETMALFTLKGPPKFERGVRQRFELELEVEDGHIMELILGELGLSIAVEYSKTRETWQLKNAEVLLDTLPFGDFCEIEGPHAAIEEVAEALGLDFDACETRGYPTLMREHLQRQSCEQESPS